MAAQLVHLCQHVEQEGLHIEVESLVVEEELGKEAEVLAVDLVVTSVCLKHRDGALAVDLMARGLAPSALWGRSGGGGVGASTVAQIKETEYVCMACIYCIRVYV